MTRHKNSHIDIGPLSRKGGGKHFLPEPVDFRSPSRICNALMPTDSVAVSKVCSATPVRPGAGQHAQYRSKGLGC
jgi:hypothetical protein